MILSANHILCSSPLCSHASICLCLLHADVCVIVSAMWRPSIFVERLLRRLFGDVLLTAAHYSLCFGFGTSQSCTTVNLQTKQQYCAMHPCVQVITISGRTIRKQAQASPEYAEAAIDCISRLLAACPQEDLDRAQEMRKARINVKAV